MNHARLAVIASTLVLGLLAAGSAFGATDLLQVYDQAAQSDPQLAAADNAFKAASEAKPQARALILPSVGASASYSRVRADITKTSFGAPRAVTFNNKSYSLNLSQVLYNRDYFVQLKQADAQVAQAAAQFSAAKQDLITRVAQTYFAVLGAADSVEFAHAEKEAINRQLEQARKRFEVGMIAITDVHEAKAAYDSSRASEIAAQNDLANAQEALREVTGKQDSQLAKLGDHMPLVTPHPDKMADWTRTALDQNLQLISAEQASRVSKEQIERNRSGHYPSLNLVASHTFNDTGGLFVRAETDNSVGIQLNVPIYQGGGVSSRVRQAAYSYEQSKDVIEQTRRSVLRQTRDAYRGVLTGISRVEALQQAVVSNESALEATEAGFEVGTRTIVDVLLAQSNLFRAKRDYAQARYSYILNTLQLKQAAGTLSVDDIRLINGWLQ